MHLHMSVRKRKRGNDGRVEWEQWERKGRQEGKRDRDKETEIDGGNPEDSQRFAKMYS